MEKKLPTMQEEKKKMKHLLACNLTPFAKRR